MNKPEVQTLGWKFKNLDDAKSLVSSDPIGSPSIDFKPIELGLAPNLSFGGADATLAINPHGRFTIAVLNDPTDIDEDEIIAADAAEIADGKLAPHLLLDNRVWLKLRAEAGVKATGAGTVADIIGLEGGAGHTVAFADYRLHPRDQSTREAFLADIRDARFVTNLDHVENLKPGEALAFRRGGTIHAAVTVKLTDLFTGQIGTLGRLFGVIGPIALSFEAGASVTADVQVTDDFVIAISRVSDNAWRAGLRKARSNRIAPSVDAGISVGLADEKGLEKLLSGVVDSVLGAPLAEIKPLLEKASLNTLDSRQRKLAMFVADRLGLEPAITTLDDLRKRVEAVEATAADTIKDIAETRIALSFAYEYVRIEQHVNLLQVTLNREALKKFHADLLRGRTLQVTQSLLKKEAGVGLESYLNQKSVSNEHSWGFTLAFGKWVSVGGRDFKRVRRVQRVDLERRVQESYLGARGYKGSWVGETFEWAVDLRADMKNYASEPKVNDFSFGMHLAWLATQKNLSATELEQWLDSALIWRVVDQASAHEIRGRMAKALDREARLEVHITIPNTVFRSVLPLMAKTRPEDYAAGLATAMPWMKDSLARTDSRRRRAIYEPLWRVALADRDRSSREWGRLAADRLKEQGHPELMGREMAFPDSPDAFSFAGLVRINGNTRQTCAAFSQGAAILQSAIESGERNQKTIDKAVDRMNDMWEQSHHVRAIGVQLLDLAEAAHQLAEVSRSMTVQANGLPEELVVTA